MSEMMTLRDLVESRYHLGWDDFLEQCSEGIEGVDSIDILAWDRKGEVPFRHHHTFDAILGLSEEARIDYECLKPSAEDEAENGASEPVESSETDDIMSADAWDDEWDDEDIEGMMGSNDDQDSQEAEETPEAEEDSLADEDDIWEDEDDSLADEDDIWEDEDDLEDEEPEPEIAEEPEMEELPAEDETEDDEWDMGDAAEEEPPEAELMYEMEDPVYIPEEDLPEIGTSDKTLDMLPAGNQDLMLYLSESAATNRDAAVIQAVRYAQHLAQDEDKMFLSFLCGIANKDIETFSKPANAADLLVAVTHMPDLEITKQVALEAMELSPHLVKLGVWVGMAEEGIFHHIQKLAQGIKPSNSAQETRAQCAEKLANLNKKQLEALRKFGEA